MIRRDFLRSLALTAAGLYVADDVMELLSHRKVWPGADFGGGSKADIAQLFRDAYVSEIEPWIRSQSAVARMFERIPSGSYKTEGRRLVFASDIRYSV